MKQKRIGKKLNLNKNTIAVLDSSQIKAAYGGYDPGDPIRRYCPISDTSCPPTEDPTATAMQPLCPCCF